MSHFSGFALAAWRVVGQVAEASAPAHANREAVNSIGMKLALIPAGDFAMGSTVREFAYRFGEQSQHRVRITKPFWLGRYDVTQAEYRQVMETNPSGRTAELFEGSLRRQSKRLPASTGSWPPA